MLSFTEYYPSPLNESLEQVQPFYATADSQVPTQLFVNVNIDNNDYIVRFNRSKENGLYLLDVGLNNNSFFQAWKFSNPKHVRMMIATLPKIIESALMFLPQLAGLAIGIGNPTVQVSKNYLPLAKALLQRSYLKQTFTMLPVDNHRVEKGHYQYLFLGRKGKNYSQIFDSDAFAGYALKDILANIPGDALGEVGAAKMIKSHLSNKPSNKVKFGTLEATVDNLQDIGDLVNHTKTVNMAGEAAKKYEEAKKKAQADADAKNAAIKAQHDIAMKQWQADHDEWKKNNTDPFVLASGGADLTKKVFKLTTAITPSAPAHATSVSNDILTQAEVDKKIITKTGDLHPFGSEWKVGPSTSKIQDQFKSHPLPGKYNNKYPAKVEAMAHLFHRVYGLMANGSEWYQVSEAYAESGEAVGVQRQFYKNGYGGGNNNLYYIKIPAVNPTLISDDLSKPLNPSVGGELKNLELFAAWLLKNKSGTATFYLTGSPLTLTSYQKYKKLVAWGVEEWANLGTISRLKLLADGYKYWLNNYASVWGGGADEVKKVLNGEKPWNGPKGEETPAPETTTPSAPVAPVAATQFQFDDQKFDAALANLPYWPEEIGGVLKWSSLEGRTHAILAYLRGTLKLAQQSGGTYTNDGTTVKLGDVSSYFDLLATNLDSLKASGDKNPDVYATLGKAFMPTVSPSKSAAAIEWLATKFKFALGPANKSSLVNGILKQVDDLWKKYQTTDASASTPTQAPVAIPSAGAVETPAGKKAFDEVKFKFYGKTSKKNALHMEIFKDAFINSYNADDGYFVNTKAGQLGQYVLNKLVALPVDQQAHEWVQGLKTMATKYPADAGNKMKKMYKEFVDAFMTKDAPPPSAMAHQVPGAAKDGTNTPVTPTPPPAPASAAPAQVQSEVTGEVAKNTNGVEHSLAQEATPKKANFLSMMYFRPQFDYLWKKGNQTLSVSYWNLDKLMKDYVNKGNSVFAAMNDAEHTKLTTETYIKLHTWIKHMYTGLSSDEAWNIYNNAYELYKTIYQGFSNEPTPPVLNLVQPNLSGIKINSKEPMVHQKLEAFEPDKMLSGTALESYQLATQYGADPTFYGNNSAVWQKLDKQLTQEYSSKINALPPAVKSAIVKYTGNSTYGSINGSLRTAAMKFLKTGKFSAADYNALHADIEKMAQAYDLLPPLTEDLVVYRGGHIPDGHDWNMGEYIIEPGFSSTSIKTSSFGGDNTRFMFILPKGSKVVPILNSSNYSGEKEVILPAFSIFKPLEKFIPGNGYGGMGQQNMQAIYIGNAMKYMIDEMKKAANLKESRLLRSFLGTLLEAEDKKTKKPHNKIEDGTHIMLDKDSMEAFSKLVKKGDIKLDNQVDKMKDKS